MVWLMGNGVLEEPAACNRVEDIRQHIPSKY
jgi:hypothetical protein